MKYVFITPWKISKNSLLYPFVEEFLSRISKHIPCEIVTPQSPLEEKELANFYLKEIKKLNIDKPICFAFDENGISYSSKKFAKELKQQEINAEKYVLFCFGSAYGLPKEILSVVRIKLISLSELTFAHELSFSIAMEQIYRARCIMDNHPYHHGEKSALAKVLSR